MMRREGYIKGVTGEARAEEYLSNRGMTCVARRYRAQDGEIDLIMDDHGTIVFVEVKSRPRSMAGTGLIAVTPAKQRRIIHAAMDYLAKRDGLSVPVRFDVVEITSAGIRHVPNAFQCSGW